MRLSMLYIIYRFPAYPEGGWSVVVPIIQGRGTPSRHDCAGGCEFRSFFQMLIASSQRSNGSPPHRCCITSQVLCRTMFSTPLSCRTSEARRSVRASRGKNLPEYGSNRSSTTRSRSFSFSSSLSVRSGSSGSGLAATRAQ